MNIKELKEYIKDLPDDMEVKVEKFKLIGGGEYNFDGFISPNTYIEDNTLELSE